MVIMVFRMSEPPVQGRLPADVLFAFRMQRYDGYATLSRKTTRRTEKTARELKER
jgi:hypothetical protein